MPDLMISPDKQRDIIKAGEATYLGYVLLDFCSNHYYVNRKSSFRVNGNKNSFREYVVEQIQAAEASHQTHINNRFSLNGKEYTLELIKQSHQNWQVKIHGNPNVPAVSVKPVSEYSPEEFIKLAQAHTLTISQEANTGNYKFGTNVTVNGKTVQIGGTDKGEDGANGKGKIELYQLHINNLYSMLERLSAKNPNFHMLVAMATGSGKSFTQALWFLIMYLSDCSCAFATIDKALAVDQLKDDFKKLLPDAIVSKIAKDSLPANDNRSPFYTITTHEKLLKDFWSNLYDGEKDAVKHKNLFLSFDEEHEANKVELFKERIKLLAKHHPAMFLSATPSKLAYQLSGGKPVASLSKKQKEELGIAKSAVSETVKAKPARMKGKGLLQKLILAFVNAIEKHRVSSAHTYVHQSELAVHFRKKTDPFYVKADASPRNEALRRMIRWNIQCPIGNKALILTGQHDPVVNLNEMLRERTYDKDYAYKRGNKVSRDNVYSFFQLGENLDVKNFEDYVGYKADFRKQYFINHIRSQHPGLDKNTINALVGDYVDLGETSKYLEYRIFHGAIDSTLEFLTGLDRATLDHKRFHDLDGLTAHVLHRVHAFIGEGGNVETLTAHLLKETVGKDEKTQEDIKMPPNVAREVAGAMHDIIMLLNDSTASDQKNIVDNWRLDKKVHALLSRCRAVARLSDKYKTVFLMSGLQKTATPIGDKKPFFGLAREEHTLSDYKPAKEPPLKHKLSALEALDDTTKQKVYRPIYCEDTLNDSVLNWLFRKDLIGAYISKEHTTGFNDVNLHHVALLLDVHDDLNTPNKIIQGAGRNRGLNPAEQPYFMLVQDENVSASFSPKFLDKANYFPSLFRARSRNHKAVVRLLGKRMADEIQSWTEVALDPYGHVDPTRLQHKVRDIFLHEFEKIYEENDHHFDKAKAQFCRVLEDTYRALYASAKKLNKSYELAFSARVIAFILNVISQLWYMIVTSGSRKSFREACRQLEVESNDTKTKDLMPEKTYAHIVKKYRYRDLMKHIIGAKRLSDVMKDDVLKAQKFVEEHASEFMTQDAKQALKFLVSQAVHAMGTPSQQIELLKLIERYDDWGTLIFQHRHLFDEKKDADSMSVFFEIIQKHEGIKKYLDDHHIQPSFEAIQESDEFYDNLQSNLMQIGMGAMMRGRSVPDAITGFAKENLQQIVFALHPHNAQFFLSHKDDLYFSEEAIQKLMSIAADNPHPTLIIELLSQDLPKPLQAEIRRRRLLVPEPSAQELMNNRALIKKMQDQPAECIDSEKVRVLLGKTLARFIEAPVYLTLIEKILAPLSKEHLLTILNACYPEEKQDNAHKVELLLSFREDLKGKMPAEKFFEKYGKFKGVDPRSSDFYKIHDWLYKIYEEVLDSVCHYQSITDKGEHEYHLKEPKLKANRTHAIWEKRDTQNRSILTGIAKKTQFIMATIDAFSILNKVDSVKDQPLQQAMRSTADHVIRAAKKTIKNKNKTIKTDNLKPDHQQSVKLSQEFGRFFAEGKSLTPAEIKSKTTKTKSAVERIKDEDARRRRTKK